MTATVKRFKEFNHDYSWILQMVVLALLGYLVAFGDLRYARHQDLADLAQDISARQQYQIQQLERQIETLKVREDINRDAIADLQRVTERLSTIAERLERAANRHHDEEEDEG